MQISEKRKITTKSVLFLLMIMLSAMLFAGGLFSVFFPHDINLVSADEMCTLHIKYESLSAKDSTNLTIVSNDGGTAISGHIINETREVNKPKDNNVMGFTIGASNPNFTYYISIDSACTTSSNLNQITYNWVRNGNAEIKIYVAERYDVNITTSSNTTKSNSATHVMHGASYENTISAASGYSIVSGIAGNASLSVEYQTSEYDINYNLTNITATTGPETIERNEAIVISTNSVQDNLTLNATVSAVELSTTIVLQPFLGAELPDNVTATNCQKTWNKNNGNLNISRVTNDVTITAESVAKQIVVTFHANGGIILSGNGWNGSGNTAQKQVYCDYPYGTLPEANRSNYHFDGWFTLDVGGDEVNADTNVTNLESHDLYAHWTEYTYSIEFDGNGATTGSMQPIENIKANQQVTLTSNLFGKNGFDFDGWNTEPNGTGTPYANQAIVSQTNIQENYVLTLYAQWEPVDIVLPSAGPFNATYLESGTWNILPAQNGTGDYSYTVTNFDNLTGITLNDTTLSGTPTSNAKSYNITIKVVDNLNNKEATQNYTFVVQKKIIDDPVRTDNNVFTYDGNLKIINVNYDSNLANITGNSSTDAGDKTAIITLNDKTNYKWRNAQDNNVEIQWSIGKYSLNITEYATSYHANNNIYLRQNYETGVNNEMLDIQYSLSNNVAGEYASNQFTLQLISNTGNKDNYTVEMIGNLTVDTSSVNAPVKSNDTYVYNGQAKTFEFVNYNDFKDFATITYKYNNSVVTQAVNAGEYQVIVTLDESYEWSDNQPNEREFTFEILKLKVDNEPYLQESEFVYSGNTIIVETKNLTNYMAIKDGSVISATAASTYVVTVEITDGNHCFEENGSTEIEMQLEWTIFPLELEKPSLKNRYEDICYYTGQEIYVINHMDYFNNLLQLDNENYVYSATNAGTYDALFKLPNSTNYVWVGGTTEDIEIQWTISKAVVKTPTYVGQKDFVYTGTEITLNFGEYNKNIIEITGNKATNANPENQPYQAIIKLKDGYEDNYKWLETGNSSAQTILWTISKAVVEKPVIVGSYIYNGQEQTVKFKEEINSNLIDILNESNKTTNAGTKYVILDLNNKLNCEWEGGETSQLQLEWIVEKAKISSVKLKNSTFEYDGAIKTIELKSDEMLEFSQDEENEISGTEAGIYFATVLIKEEYRENYEFDNLEISTTVNWTITPKILEIPKIIKNNYAYNGTEQEVLIEGYDEILMEILGNNTGISTDIYKFGIRLRNEKNYIWEDGTTETKIYTWSIVSSNITLIIVIAMGATVAVSLGIAYAIFKVKKKKKKRKKFFELNEE